MTVHFATTTFTVTLAFNISSNPMEVITAIVILTTARTLFRIARLILSWPRHLSRAAALAEGLYNTSDSRNARRRPCAFHGAAVNFVLRCGSDLSVLVAIVEFGDKRKNNRKWASKVSESRVRRRARLRLAGKSFFSRFDGNPAKFKNRSRNLQ